MQDELDMVFMQTRAIDPPTALNEVITVHQRLADSTRLLHCRWWWRIFASEYPLDTYVYHGTAHTWHWINQPRRTWLDPQQNIMDAQRARLTQILKQQR